MSSQIFCPLRKESAAHSPGIQADFVCVCARAGIPPEHLQICETREEFSRGKGGERESREKQRKKVQR